jgi:hypothetical protein
VSPFLRRTGTLGIALYALRAWQRLPPEARQRALAEARRHGPTVAKHAYRFARQRKRI